MSTPPNELDAEAAVLSAMLLEPSTIDEVVTLLAPEHFFSNANRDICQAIYDKQTQGEPIDIVGITTLLRDRGQLAGVTVPYLGQLAYATPSVANVASHARIVREKWRMRQAIATCQTFAAQGYQPVEDTQAYLESLELAIGDITHLGRDRMLEPAANVLATEITAITQAREDGGATQAIPTGLKDLDQLMGGLYATDLVVLAARPGLGKTALATTIACNVSRPVRNELHEVVVPGYGVAFFTLEIGRGQLGMRVGCHEAEVDVSKVRKGMLNHADWTKLTAAASDLYQQPIWIDDTPAISLPDLRGRVRMLKRTIENQTSPIQARPLKLVVIDYLQLMSGKRERGDSREQEISSLSRGLKELAKTEEICVLALSQLNRAVERDKNKRPTLASLRESGAIEQDADSVLFIYRESYYDRSFPNKNEAEIDLAKSRNGPTGTVQAYFSPEPMRFHNAAKPDHSYDHEQYGAWDNER